MNKIAIELQEIHLVGITSVTNNAAEMDPATGKIGTTMNKFFQVGVRESIIGRKNPGKVFVVYTNYESDYTGNYTYFIGEEFDPENAVPEGMEYLKVLKQQYAKFTSDLGQMPAVVINTWQQIWKMTPEDFGGERAYIADLEIYDERSADPLNATVDVYIGIKS